MLEELLDVRVPGEVVGSKRVRRYEEQDRKADKQQRRVDVRLRDRPATHRPARV
jgi:hypothetical protein